MQRQSVKARKTEMKEEYVTIHQHNLQLLMIEICKAKKPKSNTYGKHIYSERCPIQFEKYKSFAIAECEDSKILS